jgi:GMP synthase-like glutamine amidotransferase
MNTSGKKKILILDYSTDRFETPVIKRWLPPDSHISPLFINTEQSFPDDLINEGFTHVIHTGSTLSITEESQFTKKAIRYIKDARDNRVFQMGICYGHQLVCKALVGNHAVRSSPNGLEAGWGKVNFVDKASDILGVNKTERIWQHHFDEVTELPEGSKLIATNSHTEIQAYINHEQNLFSTQFHPEFDKEAGNNWFLNDRKLLEENNYNVDEMVKQEPSLEAGKIFFNFFTGQNKE